MNIIEALQNKDNCSRISIGDRWLCGNGNGGWIVYESKPCARKTTVLCETTFEEVAVAALLDSQT